MFYNQVLSHSHQAILLFFFFWKMCSNSSSRYSSTLLWLLFDQPASNAQNLMPELTVPWAPKTEVNEKPTFQAAPSCRLCTYVSYPRATESISYENIVRETLWATGHRDWKMLLLENHSNQGSFWLSLFAPAEFCQQQEPGIHLTVGAPESPCWLFPGKNAGDCSVAVKQRMF